MMDSSNSKNLIFLYATSVDFFPEKLRFLRGRLGCRRNWQSPDVGSPSASPRNIRFLFAEASKRIEKVRRAPSVRAPQRGFGPLASPSSYGLPSRNWRCVEREQRFFNSRNPDSIWAQFRRHQDRRLQGLPDEAHSIKARRPRCPPRGVDKNRRGFHTPSIPVCR